MLLRSLTVPRADFETGTGWSLRPEGACRGDVCVPLPDDAVVDDLVDVETVASRMGMPLIADADHGIWSLGPWSGSGRALVTATAPELTLPDVDGDEFSLSSLHGQKVLVLSWAPY